MKRVAIIASVALMAVAFLAVAGVADKKSENQGWLGVYTQSVDYDMAEAFDLDRPYGAVVNEVVDDSPAEKGGLLEDDIIVGLNGAKVTDSDDLIDLMMEVREGDEVRVTVVRNNREKDVYITAGKAPSQNVVTRREADRRADKEVRVWKEKEQADKHREMERKYREKAERLHDKYHGRTEKRAYMGVTLNGLNEQLGEYFGVHHGEGALIERVEEDSPAERAGLRAGDVIVGINGKDVEDPGDVTSILRDYEPGDNVDVSVMRDRRQSRYTLELGEREVNYYGFFGDNSPDMAVLRMPELQGLFKGNFSGKDFEFDFDNEEFQQEMQELAEELSKMKVELHEMFNNKEFKREMEELRRELKEVQRDLQEELRELERKID